MTTITLNTATPATSFRFPSLFSILEILLAVNLREKLDADTSGDKSDASYHFGM